MMIIIIIKNDDVWTHRGKAGVSKNYNIFKIFFSPLKGHAEDLLQTLDHFNSSVNILI